VNAGERVYDMVSNSIVLSSQDPGLLEAKTGACVRKIRVMGVQADICRLKVSCFRSFGLLGSPEVSQGLNSSKR
jgi:hypothetical protein